MPTASALTGADDDLTGQPPPSAGAANPLAPEEVIFRVQPTIYPVLLAYGIAALLALLAMAATAYFNGPLWLALLISAFVFCWPLARHLRRNSVRYTLTSSKIDLEAGIFTKTTRSLPLRHIQDVTVQASLRERLMGIGHVRIDSAAELGKISLAEVPQPRAHAELILVQIKNFRA